MKTFNMYNFLILNYAINWMLLANNYTQGVVLFICIWSILLLKKFFQLMLRKYYIKLILLIIGFFVPGLNLILAPLVGLYMLFLLFQKMSENRFLISIGILLYIFLFYFPDKIHNYYENLDQSSMITLLIGLGVVTLFVKLLEAMGYHKKNIEIATLSMPIFLFTILFTALINQGDNSHDEY